MAIIIKNDEDSKVIMLNLFHNYDNLNDIDATIYFHKMVTPLKCKIDDNYNEILAKGKEKIEELIY